VVSRGSAPEAKATAGSGATSAATSAKKATKKTAQGAATKASTAKKTVAAKAPAKKAVATKSTAKPTAAKAPAKKSTAKKSPAPKAPAKAAKAAKSATKTATATAKKAAKAPAKKAPATKAAAKKAPAKKAAPRKASKATAPAAAPKDLVVLEAEDPWTKAELAEVRTLLRDDVKRLTGELAEVEEDLAGMIENSGEGAGNDQADVGSASFERDQEMVIVNNARDMLVQSQHALERIANGTYGQCENCGNPIGKARLMAFPRATLCLSCKQREERR
jgi:RNA polymerase-binding protein DksA